MAVDTNFASLFEKLKVEDPWLTPSTWESIPSQNAASRRSHSGHHDSTSSPPLASAVSESSLVRLALNAMQGVASALISIEKLSVAFNSDSADRTYHRIPSLWSRSSSTQAMGKILNSIGSFGCLVFLLGKFVDHFTCLSSETCSPGRKRGMSNVVADGGDCYGNAGGVECPPYSLVNQAFAVAVGKVLEGYICSLNTVCASVGLRRSLNAGAPLVQSSEGGAPLTSVVHPDVTLLEIYLHTKELRTRIEAVGNICNLQSIALSFSVSSFEELGAKANSEFINFHRGGNLLSHLYGQLQVADPGHYTLLKFLFVRSFEPYYGFIRSWIFEAEIIDPYEEFVVEYVASLEPHPYGKVGVPTELPLASIKERDGVSVPCFINEMLSPIIRAGQQLQVLKKLLEFCACIGSENRTYDDFLPSWNGYSSYHMFCTTPLTFGRGYLEELVIARNNYYAKMQDKIEKLLTGLEFRYQQVAPHVFGPVFLENGSVNKVDMGDRAVGGVDSEFSRMKAENQEFDALDASGFSETSSASGPEEESSSDELVSNSCDIHDQRYLSALRFSKCSTTDSPSPKPTEVEQRLLVDNKLHDIFEKTEAIHPMSLFQNKTSAGNLSSSSYIWAGRRSSISDTPHKAYATENRLLKGLANISGYSDRSNFSLECKTDRELLSGGRPLFTERICSKHGLIKEALGKVVDTNDNHASGISKFLPWESRYESDFLSGSPMLRKLNQFHLGSKPLDARSLSYFNFSTVTDPCTAALEKVDISVRLESQSQSSSSSNDPNASKIRHEKQKHFVEDRVIRNTDAELPSVSSRANLNEHNQDARAPADACGGNSWEKLLGCSRCTSNRSYVGHRESIPGVFQLPLDFIVDKCLVQEILLQYKYVSKLVIKLLDEGFELQEHLLAMRRYFFMESADWADLFLVSLQNHKWSVMEVDQKVPEIQALLELSLQRSSCERDPNKDRLFVYTKERGLIPSSAAGVNALDFLGLGYRVEWPISIILTPRALKMYAQIFSFLMKVKLAASSLTDIWCSLKVVIQLMSKSKNSLSDLRRQEVGHWNMLINMRHKLNHFVSAIQQYVQSQLSHVSWCRFLHSLKYKVKDMMDLEHVHMAYLTDSLHICFLSDESRQVAGIIENMLQCALDFRSCVITGMRDVELDQATLPSSKLSGVSIPQVMSINRKFESNLKELRLCYLKSPKRGDSGISCFWGHLNYNNYYSYSDSEMGMLLLPL